MSRDEHSLRHVPLAVLPFLILPRLSSLRDAARRVRRWAVLGCSWGYVTETPARKGLFNLLSAHIFTEPSLWRAIFVAA